MQASASAARTAFSAITSYGSLRPGRTKGTMPTPAINTSWVIPSFVPVASDASPLRRPVGRAQVLLQHLAVGAARQGGDEVDRLGRLHPAELFLAQRDQLGGAHLLGGIE